MTDHTPLTRREARAVTTDAEGAYTPRPQPKVIAATGGAAVGAAVSTIGIYAFEATTGVDLPTTVEGAILVVIVAAVTYLSGWITRPSANAS